MHDTIEYLPTLGNVWLLHAFIFHRDLRQEYVLSHQRLPFFREASM